MELKQMWLFHGCDPSLTFLTAKSNPSDRGNQQRDPAGATVAAENRSADDYESMLAALPVATHRAAMGTIADLTSEARRESLRQASELVRSCAALMEAVARTVA